MKIVDLSYTICEDMPVYPGTEGPVLTEGSSYAVDGFRETILRMFSHTGTHMDAPNHLFSDRPTLDSFAPDQFVGTAVVLDCSQKSCLEPITMHDLRKVWDKVEQAEFLLFYTGWSRHWGTMEYFGEYPLLDYEVLDYVISREKKGVGLDTIGLDAIAETTLPRHRRLLCGSDTVIIENLTRLDEVGDGLFMLYALPLKFQHADGAPVRAIACLDQI